jgi:hypothetical protein
MDTVGLWFVTRFNVGRSVVFYLRTSSTFSVCFLPTPTLPSDVIINIEKFVESLQDMNEHVIQSEVQKINFRKTTIPSIYRYVPMKRRHDVMSTLKTA